MGCHFLLQYMKVKSESEVTQSCPTLATPWTAAHQAPPSMGFCRQEYWSGVPLPSLHPTSLKFLDKKQFSWIDVEAIFSLSCIGEGNGNPLQCSCLENPRDREAWWAAVYGVTQSRTRLKRLSSNSSSSLTSPCPSKKLLDCNMLVAGD